jgi:hypothetical protein
MTTMTLDDMFAPSLPGVRRSRSTVRLTRRGRLVVVVTALLVAFAVGVFVTAAGSVATQRPGTPEPTRIVQVGSGDTLWGIASEVADGGDVRSMIDEIKQLNALGSNDLQAGQRLVVPAD